jgi:hypothetical protein
MTAAYRRAKSSHSARDLNQHNCASCIRPILCLWTGKNLRLAWVPWFHDPATGRGSYSSEEWPRYFLETLVKIGTIVCVENEVRPPQNLVHQCQQYQRFWTLSVNLNRFRNANTQMNVQALLTLLLTLSSAPDSNPLPNHRRWRLTCRVKCHRILKIPKPFPTKTQFMLLQYLLSHHDRIRRGNRDQPVNLTPKCCSELD